MKIPEILAPAGSLDSMIAAINCGANAVYLGAKALNARRNADNFDEDTLAQAVEYAHIHGAKIFLTLNTVMFDNEIATLLETAKMAAKAGIDGAIVQDLGVMRILKQVAPSLPLVASTQLAVHNLAGAKMAQEMGFKRVVLARELSLDEIANIAQNIEIETEVFVHGALCMSVSGQCYLSSMIGGRSGNRGLCAQPCRLPFAVSKDTHALSLKDLSLIEQAEALCKIGVTSLKIEGRMKRPEYVAAAVTTLRKALYGEEWEIDTLQKVFSRSGFTQGYFVGKRDIDMFGTRQKEDVTAATSVLSQLAHLATKDIAPVGLTGEFIAKNNQGISLTISDNENTVTLTGEPAQIAQNKATSEERIEQSLTKTGGTAFHFEKLDIILDDNLAVPVSQINALRREGIEKLSEIRGAVKEIAFDESKLAPLVKLEKPQQHQKLRARCNINQLSHRLINYCDEFIIPLEQVEAAIKAGVVAEKIIAEIPRLIFTNQKAVEDKLLEIAALGVKNAWCGNIGAIKMAKDAKLTAVGGWALNIANPYATSQLQALGVVETELSPELIINGANSTAKYINCGILAYGRLPLMIFRNCPVRARIGCAKCNGSHTLTDRTNRTFQVCCTQKNGESELLNSVVIYLGDRVKELAAFDFLTLYFTDETKDQVADVARDFYQGNGERPTTEFTRGLYYRGVQ